MPTYLIRAGKRGPVKIGRADDPEQRLSDLQTAHHERLELIRVVDTAFDAEPIFHERYAEHHIRGEWFNFVEEMLTFVPSRPRAEVSIIGAAKAARTAACREAHALCDEIWLHYRLIDGSRGRFVLRLAKLIGVKDGRAKRLAYGITRRVDVYEMEALRALAAKLKTEEPTTVLRARQPASAARRTDG